MNDQAKQLAQAEFRLEGMNCAACAQRIEKQVGALNPVAEVGVNLATERMTVTYDGSLLTVDGVAEAVREAGYGAVPLEPGRPIEEGTGERAIEKHRGRLLMAALFQVPLLALEIAAMADLSLPPALSLDRSPAGAGLLQLALVLPVMWIARGFYLRALIARSPNMFSLILIGTGSAFGFSLIGWLGVVFGRVTLFESYFPAVSTILTFMLLGRFLEARSKHRAGESMRMLMDQQPSTAALLVDGSEKPVSCNQLQVGDVVRIHPGEKVPADGEVISGRSSVVEAMFTGESMPAAKKQGDPVVGGSLNGLGSLDVRISRIGADTTLAQIVRLVEEAQREKAPIARLADKISRYFVPVVLLLAAGAAASWLQAGAELSFALEVFVSVLIIAYPCSLGLATPAAIMVGTGRGAQLGILVKSPAALEEVQRLDAFVVDKTGTITVGRPEVTDQILLADMAASDWLPLAAAVEMHSEHPHAAALVEAGRAVAPALPQVENFTALPGRGVVGEVGGVRVAVGSRELMQEVAREDESPGPQSVQRPATHHERTLTNDGKNVVLVAVNGREVGLIGLADQPRASSAVDLKQLTEDGVEVIMATGDHRQSAMAVASQVGIRQVVARASPQDKAALVSRLQDERRRVGVVGDGINDAPALAQANVGIAVASGTDVAVESADIVLMNSRLRDVVRTVELSRAVMRTIRQNLFWAFFYNSAGIPVAAGLLHIFGGPLLSPTLASAAMALSSVSVIGNALRLKRFS